MTRSVGTHEAKTRLSEYLNRVAYRRERILVERHGKPVAALVSVEDLRRLEALDANHKADDETVEREEKVYRALEEEGIVVHRPTLPAAPASERRPIEIQGPPLSEQIILERR